jgi:hypothetical protein
MTDDAFKCSSCGNFKKKLATVNSQLIPNGKMYLCTVCKTAGYEPRGFIIAAARYGNRELAETFVKKRMYLGDDILFAEVIDLDKQPGV